MAAAKKPVLAPGFRRERFKINEERHTALKEICPEARQHFPFYSKLPAWNGPDRNDIALLKWRRYVRNRSIYDTKFRAAIWEACHRDFMLFCVTFCWIFEPRPVPRRMPFHPFTSQVSVAAWLCETFGVRSMGCNKTRGIGLSWLIAAFCVWKWLFESEVAIALLSKDEDSLDRGDGPNPLMGKLQYVYDYLPTWAKASNPLKRNLGEHTFKNLRNNATVQGYVSTGQKLRGARFTWMFADEFAFYARNIQDEWMTSAGGTVSSICYGSTWNDYDDMFHHIMYEDQSSMLRVHAMWWNDYERWKGAYKEEYGKTVFVDEDYKHEPDYPFGDPDIGDETLLRSPWVDGELLEPGINRLKALRDLYGMIVTEQTNAFFASQVKKSLQVAIKANPPTTEGLLEIHGQKVIVQPTKKSNIRLWRNVPTRNRGPYTGYADIGGGAGKAFSVFCVLDRTGKQVLEYGVNTVPLTNFAAHCVAIARWLGEVEGDGWVEIDYDNIGASGPFLAELVRQCYGNIWQSTYSDTKSVRKKIKAGELPTYYGTKAPDAGGRNCGELIRAMLSLECELYSPLILEDMRRCSKDPDKEGQPKFPKPVDGGHGHGDFVMAAAGAWWRRKATIDKEPDEKNPQSPVESAYDIGSPHTELWSDAYR